jgi:hypothetical protein
MAPMGEVHFFKLTNYRSVFLVSFCRNGAILAATFFGVFSADVLLLEAHRGV